MAAPHTMVLVRVEKRNTLVFLYTLAKQGLMTRLHHIRGDHSSYLSLLTGVRLGIPQSGLLSMMSQLTPYCSFIHPVVPCHDKPNKPRFWLLSRQWRMVCCCLQRRSPLALLSSPLSRLDIRNRTWIRVCTWDYLD